MRRLGLLAAAALLLASPATAAPIHLENGLAFVGIDLATEDGLTAWTVNGVQHVRTQSLWVRAGDDAAEVPLSALALVSSSPSDTDGDGKSDHLEATYADPAGRFDIRLFWSLLPSLGDDSTIASHLHMDALFRNTSGGALAFSVFEYTDVDLFGSYADDVAQFQHDVEDRVTVTDDSGLGVYDSFWHSGGSFVEAALYDVTLASLRDGAPTMLSNALFAAGDVTHAVQWTVSMGLGAGFAVSQVQTIEVVPEPGVAALLALGLAGLAARRRTGGAR